MRTEYMGSQLRYAVPTVYDGNHEGLNPCHILNSDLPRSCASTTRLHHFVFHRKLTRTGRFRSIASDQMVDSVRFEYLMFTLPVIAAECANNYDCLRGHLSVSVSGSPLHGLVYRYIRSGWLIVNPSDAVVKFELLLKFAGQ